MRKNTFFRLISCVCICLMALTLTACRNTRRQAGSDGEYEIYVGSDVRYDSPLAPKGEKKRVEPDLDKVELDKPSKKLTKTDTEEKLIEVTEKFANPNGNEYDAVSALGYFRYEESEEDILKRFKTASKAWHEVVETAIGPKCTMEMVIKSKTPIDISDERVSMWNEANGAKAEAYSNVKCVISSNYAAKTLTLSFDIVKLDGSWYLANTSTLNKLQTVLTDDIYK